MTAANYLMNARKNLDDLEQVLRDAAAEGLRGEQILEPALYHLYQARQILASMSDEEGTE